MSHQHLVTANAHTVDAIAFHRLLHAWGQGHTRSFPWRATADPFHILLAEVMLHRTQARQVVPIYERFVSHYPDISTVADSSLADLQQLFFPLGLRWRIDLIHRMAVEINTRFAGRVPRAKVDLQSLPGVSDYIASAVRCFAWNEAEPLIDTNTVRVAGRLFGIPTTAESRRTTRMHQLLFELLDRSQPRNYHVHLLDLAAQVCVAGVPKCTVCPLQNLCFTGCGRSPV